MQIYEVRIFEVFIRPPISFAPCFIVTEKEADAGILTPAADFLVQLYGKLLSCPKNLFKRSTINTLIARESFQTLKKFEIFKF